MEKFSKKGFMNSSTGLEPWIETRTGDSFWFNSDDTFSIHLEDIAGALSKICRFTGHCKYFYSVAEHSLNVASLLPRKKKLWGLLHDASEAYLGDVSSPLKTLLPEYKKIEERVMSRIACKFNLPQEFWKDPEVKLADWDCLRQEARALIPSKGENWSFPYSGTTLHLDIKLLPSCVANDRFIKEVNESLDSRSNI